MSIQAVSWALETECPSSAAKLVLVALANYADEYGECFPSLAKLAQIAGTTRQNVSQHIKKLSEAGLVAKQERERRNGSQASNVYVLSINGCQVPLDGGKAPLDTCKAPLDPILTVTQPSVTPNGVTHTSEPDELQQAVDDWNATADEHGLSRVQKLTKSRKAKLKARLKDAGGIEGWRAALAKVSESPFLLGKESDWRANFDFMLREERFAKLMEGGYDRPGGRASGVGDDYRSDILAGLGLSRGAGECADEGGRAGAGPSDCDASTGDGSGVRGSNRTAVPVGADVWPDGGEPHGRGEVLPRGAGRDTCGHGERGGYEPDARLEVGEPDAPASGFARCDTGGVRAAEDSPAESRHGNQPRAAASVIDLTPLRSAAG